MELNPRFSNTRVENRLLVSQQLAAAQVPYAEIEAILREAARLEQNPGELETSALSQALEKAGHTVHWVN